MKRKMLTQVIEQLSLRKQEMIFKYIDRIIQKELPNLKKDLIYLRDKE